MVYYLIAIAAARRLLKRSSATGQEVGSFPPMSLLKPLGGVDPFLKPQVESFFQQDYPCFEILFAVRHAQDPAVAVVQDLMAHYPQIQTQLVVAADPPYANAKVYSMEQMAKSAQHDILVISDSDASVANDYLKALARDFESGDVGAVTNLYRGVAGPDFWSKLEALGMSTEFMAGVIVAEWLEGMKFVLGPSMAVRRKCLDAIGGFGALAEYLADDFVLGERVAQTGYRVILSTHVINHHASASGFVNSIKHRLRWNRSSRFSRPLGYLGQGFIYGLAWAIVFCLLSPPSWSVGLLAGCLVLRMWLALELGARLLKDNRVLPRFALIPLQDLLSFVSWIGGFLGREITWRGIRYRLLEGGRFAPLHPHAGIQSHRGMNQP
jgi:ceramide glucosyltransferase